jgi:hypothetical protein
VVVSGERNLLGVQDFGNDMGSLRRLFDLFEQKTELMRLLDVSSRAEGVRIYIGGESQVVPFEELSVVTAPYEVDGRIVGTLGVIGPTRMAYDRMIQIVDITSRLVGNALSLRSSRPGPQAYQATLECAAGGAVSSVGQSRGLIILWSLVQVQHGLPQADLQRPLLVAPRQVLADGGAGERHEQHPDQAGEQPEHGAERGADHGLRAGAGAACAEQAGHVFQHPGQHRQRRDDGQHGWADLLEVAYPGAEHDAGEHQRRAGQGGQHGADEAGHDQPDGQGPQQDSRHRDALPDSTRARWGRAGAIQARPGAPGGCGARPGPATVGSFAGASAVPAPGRAILDPCVCPFNPT